MREDVKRRRGSLLAAALAATSVLSGCVSLPEGQRTIKGVEYDDIPVPEQFEYVNTESAYLDVMEEGQFRSWRGTYKGGGKFSDLVPWYIESMRTHGWAFKDLQGADHDSWLRFEKAEELAEIRIYRRVDAAAGTFLNYVDAEIHPRGVEDEPVDAAIATLRGGAPRARTTGYEPPEPGLTAPPERSEWAEEAPVTERTDPTEEPAIETIIESTTPPATDGSGKIKVRIIETTDQGRSTGSTGVERYEREIQEYERR